MVVVVSLAVEFSDGYTVDDLEPGPSGLAHRVFFGVESGSRLSVVVKIEQVPERLEIEHQALVWLRDMEVDVPRVHWFGSARIGDRALARCLVTERIDSTPPDSPASLSRMGQTLQRLEAVPWRGSGLTILGEAEFVSSHQGKINALRDRLASVPAARRLRRVGFATVARGMVTGLAHLASPSI